MTHDDEARRLARHARERPKGGEDPLERLTAGDSDDAEALAALLALADGDEDAAALFAPLSTATVDRIAAAAIQASEAPSARLDLLDQGPSAELRLDPSAPEAHLDRDDEPSNVVQLSTWRRAIVPLFAVAAAALLFVSLPGPLAPLPDYALTAEGGAAELRADRATGAPLRTTAGAPLVFVLQPATRVDGPIGVVGFMRRGDEIRAWAAEIELATTGAVRLSGATPELEPGLWDAVLYVGRPDALPNGPGQNPAAESVRTLVQPLEVVAPL